MHGTARPITRAGGRVRRRSVRLATYAAGGIAWSALARLWMRLLSTTPSFTWSGTLTIFAICTAAATGCGIAAITRDGRPAVRRTGTVVGTLLALAPAMSLGMILLPTALLGGAARGRRPRRRWAARLVAVLAALPVVAFVLMIGRHEEIGPLQRLVTLLLTPLVFGLPCLAYAALFRRAPSSALPSPTSPHPTRS